jgi:hypothetical protein
MRLVIVDLREIKKRFPSPMEEAYPDPAIRSKRDRGSTTGREIAGKYSGQICKNKNKEEE